MLFVIDAQKSGTPLPPALARACARLTTDGFTVCDAASFVRDDGSVYVSSVETLGPDTYNHPAHAVEVDSNGRMSIRNRYVD